MIAPVRPWQIVGSGTTLSVKQPDGTWKPIAGATNIQITVPKPKTKLPERILFRILDATADQVAKVSRLLKCFNADEWHGFPAESLQVVAFHFWHQHGALTGCIVTDGRRYLETMPDGKLFPVFDVGDFSVLDAAELRPVPLA